SVQRVHRAALVAKEHRARRLLHIEMREAEFVLGFLRLRHLLGRPKFADRDGGAHARRGIVGPINTAALRVERIDPAGGAGHKHPIIGDGRLTGRWAARIPKRPPQGKLGGSGWERVFSNPRPQPFHCALPSATGPADSAQNFLSGSASPEEAVAAALANAPAAVNDSAASTSDRG